MLWRRTPSQATPGPALPSRISDEEFWQLVTSFSESTVEPNISENLTSNEILKAGVAPEAGIDAVLLPLEEFVKTLPPYWLRLVNGTPILQTITDPDTGEVVPRASEAQKLTPVSIRKVTPGYVPREQKAEDF